MNETIEAVAVRTLDYAYKIWGFGEGMALLGVLRAGERLDRPEWIDAVADLVEPTVKAEPLPTDHLIAVDVLRELHRLRPALDIEDAVNRFRAAVWDGSAVSDGGAPRSVHRPDLAGLNETVWVDCMHTDGPGLPPSAAAVAIDLACDRLQDGTGLFSHGYNAATGEANGVHWGRGQGWALHGLLAVAPDAVSARTATERLLTALGATEEDGHWRTIVDDPRAPLENSVSALVAAGIYSGTGTGAVDPVWRPMADRALRAAVEGLDGAGGLPVSAATPAGGAAVYLDRPTGVFPWGQGPLLLALLEKS
jgi:rhamnogalacturonyl hydrolase YesR